MLVVRPAPGLVGGGLMERRANSAPGPRRILITALGDVENTGLVWKDKSHSSVGHQWGTTPSLVEVVPVTVTLPWPIQRDQAWALDARGQRLAPVTITKQGEATAITLGGTA